MAASALLKFQDALNVGGDGYAFVSAAGQNVSIQNVDPTDIQSWRLELLYAPPGTAAEVTPGTPSLIAENANSDTVAGNLLSLEAIPGCYRVQLTVYESTGFAGTSNVDIRNVAVLADNGMIIPPYQKLPDPRPLEGPDSKPNELNFDGQPYGWAGDEDTSRLGMNAALPGVGRVHAGSTDTTYGTLDDKIALGAGLVSSTDNPTGDAKLRLTVGDQTGVEAGSAFGTTGVLSLTKASFYNPRYTASDGQELWLASADSTSVNGYVRWNPDGSTLEEVEDLGDSTQTRAILYDSDNDRMILLRENELRTISLDRPSVLSAAIPFSYAVGYYHMVTGDGFLWATGPAGAVVKATLSDLSTQVTVVAVGGGNPGIALAFEPGAGNLYGDNRGRLFFRTETPFSTLRRFTTDTDTEDATFNPSGGSNEILEVGAAAGRVWAAWDAAGSVTVGTFDAQPLGSNPATPLDISSYVDQVSDILAYDANTAFLYGVDASSQAVLLKLTHSGGTITVAADRTFSDLYFSFAAPYLTILTIHDSYVCFGARNLYGGDPHYYVVRRAAISDLADGGDITPKAAGWNQDAGVVAYSGSDPQPAYLSNKVLVDESGALSSVTGSPFGTQLKVSSTAKALNMNLWRFDTSTSMADPGTSEFRFNQAVQSTSTAMALSNLVTTGGYDVDLGSVLELIEPGYIIVLRQVQDDAEALALIEVTGTPIDNTTWWQIPINFRWSNASFEVLTTRCCHLEFVRSVANTSYNSSASLTLPAGTLNDYSSALFNGTTLVVASTSSAKPLLTGFDQSAITNNAFRKVIYNDGPASIYLAHEDSRSTAANRILLPKAGIYGVEMFSLEPREYVCLDYDGVQSRWVVTGTSKTTLGGRGVQVERLDSGDYLATNVEFGRHPGNEHNPVSIWHFDEAHYIWSDDNLTPGFDLSVQAGSVNHQVICPIIGGIIADGTSWFGRNTYDSELALQGELTVSFVATFSDFVSGRVLFSFVGDPASADQAENIQYQLVTLTGGGFQYTAESGNGVASTVSLNDTSTLRLLANAISYGEPVHVTLTRGIDDGDSDDGDLVLYINGRLAETANSTLPDGGTNGKFRVFGTGASGSTMDDMVLSSLKLIPRRLSYAEVIGDFERTLGSLKNFTVGLTDSATVYRRPSTYGVAQKSPEIRTVEVETTGSHGDYIITLPEVSPSYPHEAPQWGDRILVKDIGGNAFTDNIVVTAGTGTTIEDGVSFTIDLDYGWVELYYAGDTNWRIASRGDNDILEWTVAGEASVGGNPLVDFHHAIGDETTVSFSGTPTYVDLKIDGSVTTKLLSELGFPAADGLTTPTDVVGFRITWRYDSAGIRVADPVQVNVAIRYNAASDFRGSIWAPNDGDPLSLSESPTANAVVMTDVIGPSGAQYRVTLSPSAAGAHTISIAMLQHTTTDRKVLTEMWRGATVRNFL